jgi:hypothetical protein
MLNRDQEKTMNKRIYLYAVLPALLFAGASRADYPLMNIVADKVINKYQNATCEQLWQQKQKPKTDEEQNLIQILKDDPQMRTAFINKVAAPVVNKMFQCGMIP